MRGVAWSAAVQKLDTIIGYAHDASLQRRAPSSTPHPSLRVRLALRAAATTPGHLLPQGEKGEPGIDSAANRRR